MYFNPVHRYIEYRGEVNAMTGTEGFKTIVLDDPGRAMGKVSHVHTANDTPLSPPNAFPDAELMCKKPMAFEEDPVPPLCAHTRQVLSSYLDIHSRKADNIPGRLAMYEALYDAVLTEECWVCLHCRHGCDVFRARCHQRGCRVLLHP